MTMTAKTDVYQTVTDAIVRQLEAGVRPWSKPWTSTGSGLPVMPLRSCGTPYRGINVLLLWGAAEDRGYQAQRWMTFKQAQSAGGCVRKGEKGTAICYASKFTVEGEDGADDRDVSFMRTYTVFNIEQIDGLSPDLTGVAPVVTGGPDRIEAAEAWAKATGARIQHGGDRAFFSPSHDLVQMPPLASFRDADGYYGTLAHELTHWSGGASRLDRTFGKRFGDNAYAAEELVAELGAAFAMARLGLASEPREDHASYLSSWLNVLKADKRAIFTAASKAQQAIDYLFAGHDSDGPTAPDFTPVERQERKTRTAVPAAAAATPAASPAAALAMYETACQTHKREDWRKACHAMAEALKATAATPVDDAPEPVRPAPTTPAPRRDPTLCEFLSLRGLRDDGGELAGLDADKWHRSAPFRRKLVRPDGMALDDAAYMAWEAGYFPHIPAPSWDAADNMNPMSPDDLLTAINRELAGDFPAVWGQDERELEDCPF